MGSLSMWRLMRRRRGESFRYGEMTIRVYRDEAADAARIVVSDAPVAHTRRVEGMGNADFDAGGDLVALELFHVSEQIDAWRRSIERRPDDESRAEDLASDLQAFASRSVEQAKEMVAPH